MPCELWHTYSTKRIAASGLRLDCNTANADPPISELLRSPCKVGTLATRHNPALPGTFANRSDGIQAPEKTEATLPDPSAYFQSDDQVLNLVSIKSSSIIDCQNSVNSFVALSSCKRTVTVLPSFEVI